MELNERLMVARYDPNRWAMLLTTPCALSLGAGLMRNSDQISYSLVTRAASDLIGHTPFGCWMLALAAVTLIACASGSRRLLLISAGMGMATWAYFWIGAIVFGGVFAPGFGIYLAPFIACAGTQYAIAREKAGEACLSKNGGSGYSGEAVP